MTPLPWTMSRVSMLHIRPPTIKALSLAFIIMERKQRVLRKTIKQHPPGMRGKWNLIYHFYSVFLVQLRFDELCGGGALGQSESLAVRVLYICS